MLSTAEVRKILWRSVAPKRPKWGMPVSLESKSPLDGGNLKTRVFPCQSLTFADRPEHMFQGNQAALTTLLATYEPSFVRLSSRTHFQQTAVAESSALEASQLRVEPSANNRANRNSP